MIVIKEESLRQLKGLERINAICSDEQLLERRFLKNDLLKDIDYLKWKTDRLAVENWCKKKEVNLTYFETISEYEEWAELERIKNDREEEYKNLLDYQKIEIEKLKEKIDKNEMKNLEIKKELLLLELDSFHKVNEEVMKD